MTQASCLTKLRQLEHDMHFMEDRSRQLAGLPHEIYRTWQQSTTACREAEERANLAEQAEARADWQQERNDWLNVQWRGGCLSGLWASFWARTR